MTSTTPTGLRLLETFRNLFYTPIYVAVSGGFLYHRGLNVKFSTMPEGGAMMDMLRAGEADIAQTGISRSLVELDEGREDAPLHFAEINSRDGFFLVSREAPPDAESASGWNWSMLEGATLAPIGFTPVPWNSLRAAMLKNGVSPDSVNLVPGLSATDAIARFRAGDLDYVHLPHPQAGVLVAEGSGYLAATLGPELGHICYSSFATMPAFIDSNPHVVQAFVSGFDDALRWLSAAEDSEIAGHAQPFFPDLDAALLEDCIRQYRANRTWPDRAAITRPSFDAMRDILIDGGMVRERHAYERLVRPEFAV